jgi:hypothetical protein
LDVVLNCPYLYVIQHALRRPSQTKATAYEFLAFGSGGSTLGGCGDINRNVMTPPAPLADPAYQYAFQTANMIADLFAPSSPAFAEVRLHSSAPMMSARLSVLPRMDKVREVNTYCFECFN